MIYGNILPITGGAGALILGHMVGLDDVIAAAIVVVLAGIAAYRYGSRLGRHRTTVAIALTALAAGVATACHLAGLSWPYAVQLGLAAAIALLMLIAPSGRRSSTVEAAR